ncbi:hypothetical protein FZEAL_7503 [Fusarium zealandicum]|uniref:Mfs allantoate n=1 Tax=Fusarium zealandicum TaxID=1053134 RepID=A0A8H4XIE1_9HYPO|nr:hypothetical protein FZEAL_7503 [Fusarium zealandicum]
MASDQQQCQALQLSDAERCKNKATHANCLFCGLHSKQVYGLYKGYKRRNARLDAFDEEAPPYLKNTRAPLANDTFESIQDVTVLREIHAHLYRKHMLLGNVIDARKLHHKHFYSLNFDYGHQAYLDRLSSQRHTVLLAMGRLEKRTAKVLYQKEEWFAWVRKVQQEEEATRDKEQKKVKQEAALFRRHWKMLHARLDRMRQKEEQKRQDAYLEDAYRERMSMSAAESEDDEAWDPIADMEHDSRYRYIDLIKHFLWMELSDAGNHAPSSTALESKTQELALSDEQPVLPKKSKKKPKAKGGASNPSGSDAGRSSADSSRGQKKLLAMQDNRRLDSNTDLEEPDKSKIETEEEMRKRLSQGVRKNYEDVWGFQIVGTLENPYETHEKTAPMTKDEIESAVNDIREIKLLLFCRLLLGQASMLPAALRAGSVHEFLHDAEVVETDLRDLCLKVEEPTLQNIRDACADFARGDEAEDQVQDVADDDDDDYDDETFEDLISDDRKYHHLHTDDWLHNKFLSKHETKATRKKNKALRHKTKVTICGKTIWNHASERAMSRDGWLQFSIMAKDCDLKHSIQLCRNWAEFSDLNLLTLWQYFPASNWVSWGSNRLIQQLQELGFFPYFVDFDAQQHSRHNQIGGRSQGRRQHDIVETRNILIGHMKRNDPITRRFLQYLLMRTGEMLVMVRDGKTGRVITAPPDEYLWTYRKKQGLGRASKNEWQNVLELGPQYFDMTDKLREWRFGFDDYYDIFIWDFVPCQSSLELYNAVITELRNAWRITHPRDVYLHMEPLLRFLTREKDTMRTRQIKPGEKVESLWDTIMDERSEFRLFNIKGTSMTSRSGSEVAKSPYMFYNEANAVEDKVLFPDELTSNKKNVPFRQIKNGINSIEGGVLPSYARHFAKGLKAIDQGKDPLTALDLARDYDEDSIWALPHVWKTGLEHLHRDKPSKEQRLLLQRTGLNATPRSISFDRRIEESDTMGTMERDRSFGFKESFHAADLEPGSTEKFYQVQNQINMMLSSAHSGPADWVWFLADILDWLELRADYKDYIHDPAAPWPHSFIAQDLLRAFAAMAMFFPEPDVTSLVTKFLGSSPCQEFKASLLFDPKERSQTRPDRKSRTSYKFRNKEFWDEWNKFLKTPGYYADVYPMDWSLVLRPIVAHLYQAGIVAPAYYQNDPEVVSGMATANTEPHRPGKLDLFINYEDKYGNFPLEFLPSFTSPDQWPQVLPCARRFAESHDGARFALLRLWSAPHFYPLMVGLGNRQSTSFLDSAGRAWEWKFVPKDMPGSEFSAHHTTGRRLGLLQRQFGDRVMHRGDLILVMGRDAADLLKYCTAVAFAIQTKPWLREVDLWKSFINVGWDFLQQLDPFWLD